jgi:hypothetical protein
VIKLETQKAVPPAARAEQLFGFRLFPRPLTYYDLNILQEHGCSVLGRDDLGWKVRRSVPHFPALNEKPTSDMTSRVNRSRAVQILAIQNSATPEYR